MKENYLSEKRRFSEKEIEEAKLGFERMARRLDDLWSKERLTPEEEKEVELILNNAAVVEEMFRSETPKEFQK